jgi:hypothetical protein
MVRDSQEKKGKGWEGRSGMVVVFFVHTLK